MKDRIEELTEIIKQRNPHRAKMYLEKLYNFTQSRHFANALVGVLLHYAAEKINSSEYGAYISENEFDEILFCSDGSVNIDKAVTFLCEKAEVSREGDCLGSYKRTLDFIDENYKNHQLTKLLAAKNAGITEAELSAIMKKYAGCTFSEYLNKLRIEKSIDFLIEKRISVENTAKEVGFNSSQTYIRAFKKKMGVTPGIYRHL